jgi:hypothetical protein
LIWPGSLRGAETPALWRYVGMVRRSDVSVFTTDIPQKEFDDLESVRDPWEISEVILNHACFVKPDDTFAGP